MRRAVAARIRETAPADPAAPALVTALRSGLSVRQAAWELGFSERQLHRRSVAGFGYPPKTLQRVVRFQRALRLARSGVALAEVAAASGYADQAHLSHDVKRLSGLPLSRLLT
ncbi:helix-turn-helix domain-containing protein [Nonomuraea sp. RK-328]|nr:helix-turn-helix domain-containing protein [Nonomuraea sp. RK-328]